MIDIENFRVDDGVPVRRSGRKAPRRYRSPELARIVEKFREMRPGQSFFVAGATKKDLDFLRRPFNEEGLGYTIRKIKCDEIYRTSGVRVWRQYGEYDEL